MSLKLARDLTRERVAWQRQRRGLAELRGMSRDRPAPRPITLAGPAPAQQEAEVQSGASPFSLEALILAEIQEGARRRHLPTPVMELGRVARPFATPRRPVEAGRRPAGVLFASALRRRLPAYLVWTEGALRGGHPEDLEEARAWLDALPEEVWAEDCAGLPLGPVAPAEVGLIRGELLLEPWQLYETHVLGGDGVIVFLPTVSDEQLEELVGYAGEIGLWLAGVAFGGGDVERARNRGVGTLILAEDPFAGRGRARAADLGRQLRDLEAAFSPRGSVIAWCDAHRPQDVDALGEGLAALLSPAAGEAIPRAEG